MELECQALIAQGCVRVQARHRALPFDIPSAVPIGAGRLRFADRHDFARLQAVGTLLHPRARRRDMSGLRWEAICDAGDQAQVHFREQDRITSLCGRGHGSHPPLPF